MYKRGYEMNVRTKLPLVAFSSVTDVTVPSYRDSSNFLPIHFTKETLREKLIYGNLFEEKYADSKVYRDGIIDLLKWYGPLVSMKMYMMKEAIKTNPFNTDYFVWVDCQVTAGMLDNFEDEKVCERFSSGISNMLNDNKFLLFTLSGPQLTRVWRFDATKFIIGNNYDITIVSMVSFGAHTKIHL